MLLVVNRPHGRDRYQLPLPQSITPLGYWPFNPCCTAVRSSNVIVVVPPGTGVAVCVGVDVGGTGVGVAVGGTGVGVRVGVDVAVAVGGTLVGERVGVGVDVAD